jgi:hypothetical protein
MALADQQFRLGVVGGGIVLVAVIGYLRFCGDVSLPPKPPPPKGPSGTGSQLLSKSTASTPVYQGFLERDATAAGLKVPTVEEMSKKLVYRVDEVRHVLEPGTPPIEAAGLKLHLERSSDVVVMVIQNVVGKELAYEVSTEPSLGTLCNSARPLPFNAMVIAKTGSETRTECVWRDGMTIAVTKVETLEISPLSAWYLAQVPPKMVGIEDRLARGHRANESSECTAVMSSVVRNGIDAGDIGWRDLADFFARHRCQTYQFPSKYRALKSDGERAIPAMD